MPIIKIPNLKKGIVFTVKGPFAHFRKFYSQTSALSYAIPPRTVLSGIVGAILGISRGEVYNLMQPPFGFFVLQVISPIRKITLSANFLSTKEEYFKKLILKKGRFVFFDSTQNRTQIPMEVLVPEPPSVSLKFKVTIWHRDVHILEELKKRLKEGKFYYPIYFGISEFLASVKFDGVTESAIELNEYEGEINSVIVEDFVEGRLIKPGNKVNMEYVLVYMNSDFSAKAHSNVIYSERAEPISLKVRYAIKWEDVIWVPYELIDSLKV